MLTLKEVEAFLQSESEDIEEVRERFLMIVNMMIHYTIFSAVIRTESEMEAHTLVDEMLTELDETIRRNTHESITTAWNKRRLEMQ